MAGVKISNLPALPSAALTDLIAEVQPAVGGTTYKATLQQVSDLFGFDPSGILPLSKGGTSANLTAANGAIPYSTATAMAFLAPGSTGQLLRSGGAGAPTWTTATFPVTAGASGNVLVSNGTNWSSSSVTGVTALGAQGQALDMNTHLINNVVDPVSNQDAATKKYVDDVSQGRQLKDPVEAATTGAFSATYANGASGVGATLTGTVMAAFAPDGVTLALGDRVLFKDQASSFQNGIYTTTVLGTGAVLPVFTRSLDMDTPSQFKYATTLVLGGTVNTGRTYTQTATVVTIGTDPVTWVQTGDATGITSISAADATVTLTPDPIVATGTIAVNTATFIRAVKTQVFPASATYTPSAGMICALAELQAPGGGSGGAVSTVTNAGASAGGGGGGYCRKLYTAADIGANAAIVLGAVGAAGTAGNNAGGNAGNCTFTPAGAGAVLTANGGTGGAGSPGSAGNGVSGNAGQGGTATGGDFNIPGANGQAGIVLGFAIGGVAGLGGGSALSTGTNNFSSGNGAATAGVYGAGASGVGNYSTGNLAGRDGGAPICIVTEYCSVP